MLLMFCIDKKTFKMFLKVFKVILRWPREVFLVTSFVFGTGDEMAVRKTNFSKREACKVFTA